MSRARGPTGERSLSQPVKLNGKVPGTLQKYPPLGSTASADHDNAKRSDLSTQTPVLHPANTMRLVSYLSKYENSGPLHSAISPKKQTSYHDRSWSP